VTPARPTTATCKCEKLKLTHSPNSFPSHFSETNKQKMLLPPSCVVFSNSSKLNTHSLILFIFAFFPFFPNLSFFRLLNVILTFFIYARLLFFPFIYKYVIAGDSKYRGFLSVGAGSRLNCDWERERGKRRGGNEGGGFYAFMGHVDTLVVTVVNRGCSYFGRK
jgi:hypothetical protein